LKSVENKTAPIRCIRFISVSIQILPFPNGIHPDELIQKVI
jgi:hypothetical protein